LEQIFPASTYGFTSTVKHTGVQDSLEVSMLD